MTDEKESKEELYATARPTPDTMALGSTSGQRGAEMVAGLRAELAPSHETRALTGFAGRMMAALMMRLVKNEAGMNYIVVRTGAMAELVRKVARERTGEDITLVEIGAGFSPSGVQLAKSLPNAKVIEIDLPDVVSTKKQRLARSRNLQIPPNLSWRGADLGTKPLYEVLEGQKVDVVVAEGLNPYFKPEDITIIARNILKCLKPGGAYICDIAWEEGRRQAQQQASSLFSRQAGAFLGIAKDEQEAMKWIVDAGYEDVKTYLGSHMAEELKLPTPVMDFSVLVVGRKSATSED